MYERQKTLDRTADKRRRFRASSNSGLIVDQQELILERIPFSIITEKVNNQILVEQDLLDCGIVLWKQKKESKLQ